MSRTVSDDHRDRQTPAGGRARRAVEVMVRAPWSRYPAGVALVVVGAASLWASWASFAAGPEPCMELRQAQFTLEELIAAKDKVLDYERDPVGELVLSGKEASFVLADNLKFPVWIETRGEELFAEIALPAEDRCYNIAFQGVIDVVDGRARVVPSQLRVGGVDLSALVAGREVVAGPADVRSPEARQLLAHTRRMYVDADRVHVVVTDPRSLR